MTCFVGRMAGRSCLAAAWATASRRYAVAIGSWPLLRALLALALLAPLAAAAQPTHVIVQKGRRFTPEQITITRGDSLTFTNEDEFIHQMYSDGLFDSDEKNPGEKLVQPFTRAGTFEVRCHIHPKMRLVVRVN